MTLFIFFIFLIICTYLLYPISILALSKIKKTSQIKNINQSNYKIINILIPIHNEEKVIGQKLNSILQTKYPLEKIKILIGLDACTDQSLHIISQFEAKLQIEKHISNNRIGKPNIINKMVKNIKEDDAIILFSDADIMFDKDVLHYISNAFDNEDIGIVDIKLENKYLQNIEENTYLSLENKLKKAESILFNLFQGVSGACYAIKKKYYTNIPNNFLVDDFFISIQVFLQGKKGIFIDSCSVFENKNTNFKQDFHRKSRIAAGSFQNLFFLHFKILNPLKILGFTFVFHKLLRWLTPFFLLYIAIYFLSNYTFIILGLTLISCLLAFLLSIFGVKYNPFKMAFYFGLMQIAILIGFFKYIKGINTNVWQPTAK
jgi:cellulose synthase/poly-beta-1,6-N-acetylglucosamine synthase-like glycosyltransferase